MHWFAEGDASQRDSLDNGIVFRQECGGTDFNANAAFLPMAF